MTTTLDKAPVEIRAAHAFAAAAGKRKVTMYHDARTMVWTFASNKGESEATLKGDESVATIEKAFAKALKEI